MMTPMTTPGRPIRVLVPQPRGVDAVLAACNADVMLYDPEAPEALPAGAEDAQVLVVDRHPDASTAALLPALPRLRMIQLFSSGTDSWEAVAPATVRVAGVTGAHGRTVAEWVMAQLLSHHRRLPGFAEAQRRRDWRAERTGTLAGARVLVFGAGDIGTHLRAMLSTFGAAADLAGRAAREGVLDTRGARENLGRYDIVVLAVPLTPATGHLADAGFFARMRPGAVFVNAGRGPLVDTDALVEAARTRLGHVALDVTDPEPLPAAHPLWAMDNVVVTPHIAGITDDVMDRCWAGVARGVARFAASAPGEREP